MAGIVELSNPYVTPSEFVCKTYMNVYYPWQNKQWHAVVARWQTQRLPHALLLTGPNGLSKLDFARALAARLLCQTTCIAEEFACGSCQSCQWLMANSHPDFFILQPEAESKIIKIEQVRELLASLQQTAQYSGQKVVILEPAEAMNKAAANALLKTLEEPFGPVTFLLVAHQPGGIPATIRSRCQKIDFPIPPLSITLPWLKNQLPAVQNIESLLALTENIPLRALALAEAAQFEAHQQLVQYFIQLSAGTLSPLTMAAACVEMTEETVFTGLCLLIMDIIRLQQSPTSRVAHSQQQNALISIAGRVSCVKIFYFLDQLLAAKKQLDAKVPLNMLLLWETILIEWVNIAQPLSE